mgnify:FL=1
MCYHKQFLYRWSEPDTVAEVFRLFGTPACWRGAGSLRRLGEPASRSKLPLSNKGGTKNKKQYTLTSGKRCIYKAKPHFIWRDINYAIITMKN